MKFLNFIKKILPYAYLILYAFTTVLILIKAGENGEESAMQSSSIADYLQNNVIGMDKIAEKSEDFPTLVRKFIGHYGLFAVNGFFAILTAFSFIKKSTISIIICAILGVTIATISELIQGSTEGRTLSSTDAILNVQGYFSGIAVALMLSLFFIFKQRETLKESAISYLVFSCLIVISIIVYFVFSSKSESVDFCTQVEFFISIIWLIIEGVFLINKFLKLKKVTT